MFVFTLNTLLIQVKMALAVGVNVAGAVGFDIKGWTVGMFNYICILIEQL